MTFRKRKDRKRYIRNKEKDNTKTIINDSMYVIGVDTYSLEEESECGISIAKITGNADGTITTEYFNSPGNPSKDRNLIPKDREYKNESVLPVIEDKRVTLLQRIKNFINKIFK